MASALTASPAGSASAIVLTFGEASDRTAAPARAAEAPRRPRCPGRDRAGRADADGRDQRRAQLAADTVLVSSSALPVAPSARERRRSGRRRARHRHPPRQAAEHGPWSPWPMAITMASALTSRAAELVVRRVAVTYLSLVPARAGVAVPVQRPTVGYAVCPRLGRRFRCSASPRSPAGCGRRAACSPRGGRDPDRLGADCGRRSEAWSGSASPACRSSTSSAGLVLRAAGHRRSRRLRAAAAGASCSCGWPAALAAPASVVVDLACGSGAIGAAIAALVGRRGAARLRYRPGGRAMRQAQPGARSGAMSIVAISTAAAGRLRGPGQRDRRQRALRADRGRWC